MFSATLTMGIGPSTVLKAGKLTRISGLSTRTSDSLCVKDADPAAAPWWTATDHGSITPLRRSRPELISLTAILRPPSSRALFSVFSAR